ncbi:hypothetical protein F5Y17DRAFT_419276 [Xylariaceae sp. FL0594]|nr:hypothetical protein F5Y17DRAFT_419276 [Xylariaceae sp. FL0594]
MHARRKLLLAACFFLVLLLIIHCLGVLLSMQARHGVRKKTKRHGTRRIGKVESDMAQTMQLFPVTIYCTAYRLQIAE